MFITACDTSVSDFCLTLSLPIQLPDNIRGKAAEYAPRTWAPATHVGNFMKLLASAFSLVQYWLLWSWGNEPVDGKPCLSSL